MFRLAASKPRCLLLYRLHEKKKTVLERAFCALQFHCHNENCLLYLLVGPFHCRCCDQHQFSLNTIHTLSTEMVRRIKKMIIKGKMI